MSAMLKRDEQNTFIIQTAIRRWGNSQGIRLSKELMDKVNLKENDEINITIDSGKIIIEKINKPKYLNLQERLEKFYGKPIDEIYVESTQEVDIGTPKGKEIW
jgi:antitoxin MazE